MSDTLPPSSEPGGASEAGAALAPLLLRTLDAVPELVSYVDAQERYLFCNHRYEEWFGKPRASLLGRTVREVVGEAAYAAIAPYIHAALRGQEVRFEQVLPYEAAGHRLVEVLYTPDVDVAGRVEGLIVRVEDVTERRQREEALRSTESFRLAMLGTSDAVYDWDLTTDRLAWSSQLSTLFGYPPPPVEAGVQWWRERLHPEDATGVEASLQAGLQGKADTWQTRYRFRRSDGRWADVVDRASVLRDPTGRAVRLVGTIQDVSEREALLRAVAQRSAELEAVLQALPEAVFMGDVAGIRLANPTARALLGLAEGKPLDGALPALQAKLQPREPDTGEPLPAEALPYRLALQGHTVRRELRVHHAGTGEERVVLASAAPVQVEGRNLGAVSVHIDVTEQRRLLEALRAAQARLERSQARLHTLVDTLPVGVWLVDERGQLVSGNRAARRIWGAEGREGPQHYRDFRGTHVDTGAPLGPEDWPLARVLRTGQPVLEEQLCIQAFDGEEKLVRISAVPLHDAQGHVFGAVSVHEDITARRRLERERDEAAARLDSLFAASPVGISELDAQLRFVRVNAAQAALDGLPADEHLGRSVGEVLPGLRSVLEPLMQRVLQTGGAQVGVELSGPRPGRPGETGTWLASYFPVRSAPGAVVGVGAVVVDITARRQAEEQLRRTADFRDMFLSIVSHDLRTPLQAVLLSARALRKEPQLPEAARRLAERIQTSAERMAEMIVQLLDFARGRLGGGIPVERREGDVVEVVRGVLDELQAARPGEPIPLTVQGDGRGAWDRQRLAQVVQNLVGNALRHGAPGTTRVEVRGTPDAVLLRVRNGGPPILPELLPQLFEPFRRGAGAPGGAREGLGLGLFITREIVRAHAGDISVRSDAQEGTVFTVRLPRRAPGGAG